jgi:hypothetical protein
MRDHYPPETLGGTDLGRALQKTVGRYRFNRFLL